MRTVLVTGSDTGVGKTHVTAALARLLSETGASVQIVKVVETGHDDSTQGDAQRAQRLAGVTGDVFTLASFRAALAPAAAAAIDEEELSCDALVEKVRMLPSCDWRILEGAGGIATPVDATARDWADFAVAAKVDAVIVVVPDRLGAINQARLAYARARQVGVPCGVWLNETARVEGQVARSTREGLAAAGVPVWAEQACHALLPRDPDGVVKFLRANRAEPANETRPLEHDKIRRSARIADRCRTALAERDAQQLRREVRLTPSTPGLLSLADNDYLALANDAAIAGAVAEAARRFGTSASASPLITGWKEPHAQLLDRLLSWHRFPAGMLWTSGYAANAAVLSGLPARSDLILADRLIHNSMIAGLLRSGARLQRYDHLRLDRLEQYLAQAAGADRQIFVVTESVFSMDGDYPDLVRMAALKRKYGFFWIIDEAHALGWFGPEGAGLVRAAGVEQDVDVLVGTLGKTLVSGGAYTLFRDAAIRDYLVNTAGEFIYSTAMPPTAAAAALAAIERVVALSREQPTWQALSREFRARLQAQGWEAPNGDSPIVPVLLQEPSRALLIAQALRESGIIVAAIRPPTVPAGTSRVRFSLKRNLLAHEVDRVFTALEAWRKSQ